MTSLTPPVIQSLTPSSRFRASAMYFIFFSAVAAIAPYLVLYYRSLGFSGSQVGLLLSIGPLIGLVASPFWTGYADSVGRHLTILIMALFSGMVIYALFPFLQGFGLVLAAASLLAFLTAPVFALLDSSTVYMLGDEKDRYGRIRLWGTIGWGISAPIVGEVLERYGLSWMFWIYSALIFIDIFFVRYQKFDTVSVRQPYWQGLRLVLGNPAWIMFLVGAFVTTFGLAAHGSYLSLLLEDMGARRTLLGVTITVSTIFEVPVMIYSSTLLRRFGNRGLMFIALGTTALRSFLYSIIGGPGWVIGLQVLHGLTYPALWLAGVNFAADHAPPGFKASTQALFGAVQGALGGAAGNMLSGYLIDRSGVQGMYATISLLLFVSLGVLLLANRRVGRELRG